MILINQNPIIFESDLVTLEEVEIAKENSNLEGLLKNRFIEILRRNSHSKYVVKLVDLKNAYSLLLDLEVQNDENVIQIFKNLIGSNKDNKTSLLRSPHVSWYYTLPENENDGRLIPMRGESKPIPLPLELERSRVKRYYAYYSSEINDSPLITIDEAIVDSIIDEGTIDYNDIDFRRIRRSKIDYIERQRESTAIGLEGERYIFDIERKRLKSMGLELLPVWVSLDNDKFGFDILSFEIKDGELVDKYIEVKTSTGDLYSNFYISQNEVDVSIKYSDNYYIYRVYDAGDLKTINHKEFKGSVPQNRNFENVRIDRTHIYKVVRR